MKQGSLLTKLVLLFLFAGVAAYLGAAAWRSFNHPFSTVMTYTYTMDDAAEAAGYLARQETVLPGGSGIMDIVPDEGEKVGAGQTIAVLYRDEEALQRRQTLRSLELKLDQLEYSLRQGGGAADAAKLDEQIYSAMTALRVVSVNRSYFSLENQSLALKSLVFRREYTRSDAAAGIEGVLASVSAEIAALRAAAAGDTSYIVTPGSGIYSGLADGYEAIWTPAALSDLTVSGYQALAGTPAAETGNSVGKLITSSRWYFAALLSETDAGRLKEGGLVTVAFTRDFCGEVSMRVEQISKPENGQAAVVFSSTRHLSDITLLRRQKVDIIFCRHTGIRVPKKALRVLEDGTTGVYAVAGAVAEFKPVSVLAEGEDFYLLAAAGGASGRRVLRAGDEVIVAAETIYDGKVVR